MRDTAVLDTQAVWKQRSPAAEAGATRGILHSSYLLRSQLLATENMQLFFNWGFNLERL